MRQQRPMPPPKFKAGSFIVNYFCGHMTVLNIEIVRAEKYCVRLIIDTVNITDAFGMPMRFPEGWHDTKIIDNVYTHLTDEEVKLLEILK